MDAGGELDATMTAGNAKVIIPPCAVNGDALVNILGIRNMMDIPVIFGSWLSSLHMIIKDPAKNVERTGWGCPAGARARGHGHNTH